MRKLTIEGPALAVTHILCRIYIPQEEKMQVVNYT